MASQGTRGSTVPPHVWVYVYVSRSTPLPEVLADPRLTTLKSSKALWGISPYARSNSGSFGRTPARGTASGMGGGWCSPTWGVGKELGAEVYLFH
jgi:hypothetical protein